MLKPSAQRVQDAIHARGFTNQVIELADSTRSAAEAAAAVGCDIAQIAKSLIFQGKSSGEAILVIASGANRVNEKAVGKLLGQTLSRPNAEFVREQTGYAIGGVPPLGHDRIIKTLIDEDLLALDIIYAAAGHPFALFALTPTELVEMTGGAVISIQ